MTREDLRIVVAGVCASGKSTLVKSLRELGYQARAVAQEHSYAPRMYTMSNPDFVIVLDAGLDTVKERRPMAWDQDRLDTQEARLSHVREHCNLYLRTDHLTRQQVLEQAVAAIEGFLAERNAEP